jgi:hypothetical protein
MSRCEAVRLRRRPISLPVVEDDAVDRRRSGRECPEPAAVVRPARRAREAPDWEAGLARIRLAAGLRRSTHAHAGGRARRRRRFPIRRRARAARRLRPTRRRCGRAASFRILTASTSGSARPVRLRRPARRKWNAAEHERGAPVRRNRRLPHVAAQPLHLRIRSVRPPPGAAGRRAAAAGTHLLAHRSRARPVRDRNSRQPSTVVTGDRHASIPAPRRPVDLVRAESVAARNIGTAREPGVPRDVRSARAMRGRAGG